MRRRSGSTPRLCRSCWCCRCSFQVLGLQSGAAGSAGVGAGGTSGMAKVASAGCSGRLRSANSSSERQRHRFFHATSAACSLRLGFLPFTHDAARGSAGFPSDRLANYTAHTVLTSFNGIYRRTFFIQQVKKRLAQEQWRELPGVFSFSASSSIRRRIESDSDSLSRTVPVPEQRGQRDDWVHPVMGSGADGTFPAKPSEIWLI